MIDDLATRIAALDSPVRLVGIDGPGGAGKSTLAEQLRRRLGDAVVVHMDDFYRVMDDAERRKLTPEEACDQSFDWERLRDQVLSPLQSQRAAVYQRYDWESGRLAESHRVDSDALVIVEGVGSTRRELRGLYDFRVWVQTPKKVCLERQYARGHGNEDLIPRWRETEECYEAIHRPKEHADFVYFGA
ncbi:MAG: AAA family ATPase [Planctomycetota bacterium]